MFGASRRFAGRLIAAVALGAAGAALSSGHACCAEPSPHDRPSFIFIIADDVGRDDIGVYGHRSIRTPNFDRLAGQGLRLDRAFLTCSTCSPSRCSILTGRYPHATGAAEEHDPLPPPQATFVEALGRAGYYTASSGKWHLGDDAVRRFDRVKRAIGGLSGCENWVETLRERPKDRPFFLWLAANDAHRPFERLGSYPPYAPADVVVPPFLPDVPEVRADFALYYGEITRLDDYVGRVLAELERQGVAGNTLVLFLSDNGRPFPRCKVTVYDSGIKTAWIVRFPGRAKAGASCPGLVSAVDLAPTVLELAGLKPLTTVQGRSFAALLADPAAKIRDEVYAEQNWHDFAARKRAVRTERFKYIRNFHPDLPNTPPADTVRTLTFQAMRRLRDRGGLLPVHLDCFVRPRPAEELYDVEADPHELHNLASMPSHAPTLEALRAALARWRRETGDLEPPVRRPDEYDRETGERLPVAARGHEGEH
jgi:arylsulfatase A-like enzyme